MTHSLDSEHAIAIVGVACKFKGVENLQDYWELLKNGENRVSEIPPERWNLQAFYSEDPDAPGKTYVRKAGLIEKFDHWDNQFFGVSDVEAAKMDPQQRWLVECTYRALENAGITRDDVNGTKTGVYIGAMNNDYNGVLNKDLGNVDAYSTTGGDVSVLSARLSYLFNLLGPSISLNTACSSSLVAVHLAVQALQSGECSLAICGGVNCLLSPDMFITLSKARMLSPTGQSQAFSAQADGYARGEGCGVLILKSLGQALKDRDHIWATIGTGVNQDGRTTTPITAPSGEQQKALFHQVYERYNVNPIDIQYFEAHGTGTPVGDPIEATSIGQVIGQARAAACQGPCPVGSVKTNLGHTESAAGIASVIKVLLMMKHGKIVPSLFSQQLNPKINTSELHLHVPTMVTDWTEKHKLAAVNSFGYGGTNAHAVLKEYIPPQSYPTDTKPVLWQRKHEIILCSAPKQELLVKTAQSFAERLTCYQEDNSIADISYTTTARQHAYKYRTAFTIKSTEDAIHELKHLTTHNVSLIQNEEIHTVFVFNGMGTSWKGMCAELMQTEPRFANKIIEIDKELSKYDTWSLAESIRQKENITDPARAQPMLFACQVALATMWKHWGVNPNAVLGHSVGEVAAAHVAGVVDIVEAVRIIFHRGRLLSKVTGGKMLVVGNYEVEKIRNLLVRFGDRVEIAAENSATSCTLSGDSKSIVEIHKEIENIQSSDIFLRELSVNTAFHSHHVDPILAELRRCLHCTGGKANCNLISTVTGESAKDDDFRSSSYWEQNIRKTVKFGKAIKEAGDRGKTNIIIEIGPRPALSANIKENLSDLRFKHIPSMKPGSEMLCLQQGLCQLYCHGMMIDWAAYHSDTGGKFIKECPELSLVPKQLYYQPEAWIRKTQEGEYEPRNEHPFVKPVAHSRISARVDISKETTPFVYDHRLGDSVVVPGATFLEIATATVMSAFDGTAKLDRLRISVYLQKRITVSDSGKTQLFVRIEETNAMLNVMVEAQGDQCAYMTVDMMHHPLGISHLSLEILRDSCTNVISSEEIYNMLRGGQFHYGDQLSLITEGRYSPNECLTELCLPESVLTMTRKTFVHPSVLDAMNQSVVILLNDVMSTIMVPVAMEGCRILGPFEKEMTVYLKLKKKTRSDAMLSGAICNKDGTIVFICETIRLVSISSESNQQRLKFELAWEEITESGTNPGQRDNEHLKYLILEDVPGLGKFPKRLVEREYTEMLHLSKVDHALLRYIEKKVRPSEQSLWRIIVVFAPRNFCSKENSSTVHTEVIKKCTILGDLLKGLQVLQLDVPLFVVTCGSQFISSNDVQHANTMNSLCFEPIWAFARSVLWEMMYKNLYLVDVGSMDRTDLSALTKVAQNQIPKFPEWAVREGRLYVNQISRINQPVKCQLRRKQRYDHSNNFLLCSASMDILNDPYLVLHEEMPVTCSGIPVVDIKVKRAVIPAAYEYPVTVHAEQHCSSIQTLTSIGKHPVITLSVVGREANGNALLNSEDIATLYPATCQSFISVPRRCTIQLRDIPHGSELILPKIYIVYQLLQVVKDRRYKHVLLLRASNEQSLLEQLVITLLRGHLGTRFESITAQMLLKSPLLAQNALVIITSAVRKIDVPGHISLLVLEESVDKKLAGYMRFSGHKVGSVSTTNIFAPSFLLKAAPAFFKWLKGMKNIVLPAVPKVMVNSDSKDTKEHSSSVTVLDIDTLAAAEYRIEVEESELFRRDAIYVLAGGLTGLGWDLACLMARNGAGLLVFLSRSPPTNTKLQAMVSLEEDTGAKLVWAQCDISDFNMTMGVMRNIRQTHEPKPIKGIFHSAVVYADSFLLQMSPETFEKAMVPKVKGSWNLHLLTLEDKLDYFVMHSSISSLLGNAGQTNYAAANAFMDALAHYRRAQGLPGQTINWGALDTGVLERSSKTQDLLTSFGWGLMNKDVIRDCFINALLENRIRSIYFDVDWNVFSKTLRQGNAYIDVMSQGRGVMNGPELGARLEKVLSVDRIDEEGIQGKADEIQRNITALEKAGKHQAQELSIKTIECIVGSVLGEVVSENGPDTSLTQMGLDSMFGMVLRTQIKQLLKVTIPLEVILHPDTTVRSLASFLRTDSPEENISEGSVPKNATSTSSQVADPVQIDTTVAEPGLTDDGKQTYKDVEQQFVMSKGRRSKTVLLQLRKEFKRRWLQWANGGAMKTLPIRDICFRSLNGAGPGFVVEYNGKAYTFKHKVEEIAAVWVEALEKACKEDKLVASFIWADGEKKLDSPKKDAKSKTRSQPSNGRAKLAKYRSLDTLQYQAKDISAVSYKLSSSTYL